MVKKKRKQDDDEATGGASWMDTYSDMMTLLLCFFAIMFNPAEITEDMMAKIRNSMQLIGVGALIPGNRTATEGKLKNAGGVIDTLPSNTVGKTMGEAVRATTAAATNKAQALFAGEVRSKKVRITTDERGLVISFAADAFFAPASDQINIEQTRDILLRLGTFLNSEVTAGMKFKIEGHTDGTPIDPYGQWTSNWQLSAMRAINVLAYLVGLGVNEQRFEVSGFADTMPLAGNDTPEGRAYNRRVDIVIMPAQVDTI
jgi:chemotaxis protein MotB